MSKRYMMVVRNFNNGTLKFPYCDVTRQEIDDAFTVHLREIATGEIPFFLQRSADEVVVDEDLAAAHGLLYLTAYAYDEGQVEVSLEGCPEFAYCVWKRKPQNEDWVIWSVNHSSVLCSPEEAETQLFHALHDEDRVYSKTSAEMAYRHMLRNRIIALTMGNVCPGNFH